MGQHSPPRSGGMEAGGQWSQQGVQEGQLHYRAGTGRYGSSCGEEDEGRNQTHLGKPYNHDCHEVWQLTGSSRSGGK